MTSGVIKGEQEGQGRRIAVVVSEFNEMVTRQLLKGCVETLRERGVANEDITVVWVPGAFEIPSTALRIARQGACDAIVCLGAVIRGETPHFEHISSECARGIGEVSLQTGVPAIFGVLTTENVDQALQRAGGKAGDKGADAARAALELASVFARVDEKQ